MKYQLMIRSRPSQDERIVDKHEDFMRALFRMKNGWGLTTKDWPKAKKQEPNQFFESYRLKNVLPEGLKGEVRYSTRKVLSFYTEKFGPEYIDRAQYDDSFCLEFNPEKIDFTGLVQEAFAKYLGAFHAYVGEIFDMEFNHIDFDKSRQIESRSGVYRINPVNFFDRELCRRAFALEPKEIVSRLQGKAESASVECDGALIIASSQVLTMREADEINVKLKPLLTGKRVQRVKGLDKIEKELASRPAKEQKQAKKNEKKPYVALARALIDAVAFLELSDDDTVDPDSAVKAMESIAWNLNKCSRQDKQVLKEALAELVHEEKKSFKRQDCLQFYEGFMDSFHLEDD